MAAARIIIHQKKKNKYRNIPTIVDGLKFPSKKEAKRYGELKLMLKAGAISRLELQPEFPLDVVGQYRREKIGTYVADFSFWSEGKRIVEDVKGFKTPLYKWKKKHVEAQYGVKIVEI